MNEQEIDAKIDAILQAGKTLGSIMSAYSKELVKAAAAFGEALSGLLPKDLNPLGWDKSWERQIKKLTRRERYQRRYRQRGLRMKKSR